MNRAIVLIFVVIISLPLAANLAGVDGADSGAENRELAAFPPLDDWTISMADYGSRFAHWFDDHFGFRSRLVRWYGETRLFGLGASPAPTVIKGRDAWFFYGEDGSIDDYARVDPMTPAALDNWRAATTSARDWLRARAIAYVFFIAPDKYVIYPEMMPPAIRQSGAVSRTDQLYDALASPKLSDGSDTPDRGGFTVDVRPALMQAKAHQRIYHQTDTHWNDRGALVAYQTIIDAVRRQLPAVPPAWTRDDFEPQTREVDGMDLAGMMGLTRVIKEVDLALVPKRARHARVIEPAGAEPTAEEGRLVTELAGSSLPRAVIFRDSFVSRLVPFLSEHFSRAVYVWQNDFDAALVTTERPDVVVQEIVGRHLYNFIPSPELVPK
jgi:alginate O-acetyltransferase complex protein AlgJ